MRYRQLGAMGGRGFGEDQFKEALHGIGVGITGLIHAAGDNEVKVFDREGRLRNRWRTRMPGYCVAIDRDGAVYVGCDGRIERFDSAGAGPTTWGEDRRLGRVTAIGLFDEFVLAGDATGRCIHRYDKDGKFLNDIGKNNRTNGFLIPNSHLDFAVDAGGTVHAANPGKHRVERYTLAGELLGHFGKFGTRDPADFGGCCNPTNLALGPNAEVVVTEKAPARLKIYDGTAALVAVVGTDAFDPNCKNMDVATDSGGRVYVVDTVGLRIQVFAPAVETQPERASTKTNGGEAP